MRTEVQRQTEVTHRLQDEVEAARRESVMKHTSVINHHTHTVFFLVRIGFHPAGIAVIVCRL